MHSSIAMGSCTWQPCIRDGSLRMNLLAFRTALPSSDAGTHEDYTSEAPDGRYGDTQERMHTSSSELLPSAALTWW